MYKFLALAVFSASLLPAGTFTYGATGTLGGQQENALATFITGNGTVTVTLDNLISNPVSAIQNISDLYFSMNNTLTSASLFSSSGTELTVNGDGTFTVGSSVPTGWTLSNSGAGTFLLEVLGTQTAPAHTIIGPSNDGTYNPSTGQYSAAQGSLTNGTHSPFLESGTTFTINMPGVTADTAITSAIFSFNTDTGYTLPGTPTTPTPEPTSMLLMGGGLIGLSLFKKRGLKKS